MTGLLPFEEHRPAVAGGAWVAPGATVVGRVEIADGASVWYCAVIRADLERIVVGAGSNVQDGAVLHADPGVPTLVGAGVSIGHGAVVHGCVVEDDCLIGIRAAVLNGARVGAGSLVAAGAVVLEGTDIPPRSLVVGVPGKVRRQLTEEEYAGLLTNARTYRDLAARHARPATP
ncbi:gamma carbonic anhydrase family protein [Actinopolymorpha pittospori]